MSQYIRPDNNLRWFKDGVQISSDGQKYKIHFEDGDPSGGVVDGRVVPSRVSVLVVLNFELQSDTGCYCCKTVGGSQRSESAVVNAEAPGRSPLYFMRLEAKLPPLDPFVCKEPPTTASSSVAGSIIEILIQRGYHVFLYTQLNILLLLPDQVSPTAPLLATLSSPLQGCQVLILPPGLEQMEEEMEKTRNHSREWQSLPLSSRLALWDLCYSSLPYFWPCSAAYDTTETNSEMVGI